MIRKLTNLPKPVLLILVVLLMIMMLSSYNPAIENRHHAQTTPSPQDETSTPTALPEEFLTNREQTRGIVIGGIILVLIVVIATSVFLQQKE